MGKQEIRVLGQILAKFVLALGMMSENIQRGLQGFSMAYNDCSFSEIAKEIEKLANELK